MPLFQPGNTAASGNRGGGRPTNRVRDLANEDAPRIWQELAAIAFDASHPDHRKHGFAALRTLAGFAFPRPQAVSFEVSEEGEAAPFDIRLLAERAARGIAERQQRIHDNGICQHCDGSGVSAKRPHADERT